MQTSQPSLQTHEKNVTQKLYLKVNFLTLHATILFGGSCIVVSQLKINQSVQRHERQLTMETLLLNK